MRKRIPSELLVPIFSVFVLSSCISAKQSTPTPTTPILTPSPVPPTSTPEPTPSSDAVHLEMDGQEFLFEFLQNNMSVPVSDSQNHWNVTLEPDPFTLMVHGNKEAVSIIALESLDLASPLQQVSPPLVSPTGTGHVFWERQLLLFDQPLEIYEGNLDFFSNYGIVPSDKIPEAATFLKDQFGVTPRILMTGRAYLGNPALGGASNYSIEKIGEKMAQSGESVILVIFVERLLERDPVDAGWRVFSWMIVNIEFS